MDLHYLNTWGSDSAVCCLCLGILDSFSEMEWTLIWVCISPAGVHGASYLGPLKLTLTAVNLSELGLHTSAWMDPTYNAQQNKQAAKEYIQCCHLQYKTCKSYYMLLSDTHIYNKSNKVNKNDKHQL